MVSSARAEKKDFATMRKIMVEEQIKGRGINDERILEVFGRLKRELFVEGAQRSFAYCDSPLPIGYGQTISQPYIVALMTEALCIVGGDGVLEIGCGSGYQAAVLCELGAKVYSVERIKELELNAKALFERLGYDIKTKVYDGALGWKKYAPYDRVIVTAAASHVPSLLFEQLKTGGKLIMPIGSSEAQDLTVFEKTRKGQIREEKICSCRFVPFVSSHEY
jgi:protein-L-isoaspartate(D-aspartate) O-methyltransferase